jgi:hypothetical protein
MREVQGRSSPSRSRRSPPAGFVRPAQPTLVAKPPSGPGWTHRSSVTAIGLSPARTASGYGTDFTDKLARRLTTGRHVLAAVDYLYDAARGLIGFRSAAND